MRHYRLATKNSIGEVVQFGPLMPLAIASKRRADMERLGYTAYVVNVTLQ